MALLLLLVAAAPAAGAQSVSTSGMPSTQILGVAVYRYAEPGQPVITVDLMGTVRQAGRYFVAPETRVLDLLALAGGVTAIPETDQSVKSVTVEVSRAGEGTRSVVFTGPIEDLTSGKAASPLLLDGDIVTVTTAMAQRFDWLDGVSVAGSVAAIAFLILRIAGEL